MNVQLKYVATIYSGYLFREAFRENVDGNARVIRIRDLDPIKGIAVATVARADVANIDPHQVQRNDVLLVARGERKFAVLVEADLENTVCSGEILGIRFGPKVDPAFFCWYVNRPNFANVLSSYAQGTYVTTLYKHDVEHLFIDVPELAVQQRIGKLMQLHRRLVETEARRMALREEYMQAVAHRLFKGLPLTDEKPDNDHGTSKDGSQRGEESASVCEPADD